MKAVGYYQSLPINAEDSLIDLTLPTPKAQGRDLLVAIKAVSVNPIDTKVRKNKPAEGNEPRILGWDASGIVEAVGDEVSLFKPGDEVWYAGSLVRHGTNSEYHLVDEQIVAKKPQSLTFQQAAALPLTSITAWEIIFDRLNISPKEKGAVLIIGAAGGVGSILVQLLKQLTQLTIIGTASRPESVTWVLDHGAHHVIDHSKDIKEQLKAINTPQVDYVISLTHTDNYTQTIVEVLKPQGKFALIDDPQNLDIKLFKWKSISIHWESMFTRSTFKTPDMIKQHEILTQVAKLVDEKQIKTTFYESMGCINATNLKKAHALIESGAARGKIVLAGF